MTRISNAALIMWLGLLLVAASTVLPVAAGQPPVAAFTHSPERPIINQNVVFNASASNDTDGYILSYTWDFGDGAPPITIAEPVTYHNYTAFGTYNVTLTVTDNDGLNATAWDILTIRKYPVASFTWSPASPHEDETVTFNASLSTPDGGTITSYAWAFGNGATANVSNPVTTYVYAAGGNYTVTLTIADSEGLTDTCTHAVMVRQHPTAFFTYSPAYPLVNQTVKFNASLSTPDGGTIVNYTWAFGDGNLTTVSYPVINHTYTAFGTYNVTLTVTDSENLSNAFWCTVRILIHPVAKFSYSPSTPVVNNPVTLDASASYDPDLSIVSYRWSFGDGNITTVNYPVTVINHVYAAAGTYNVSLVVTDNDGLTNEVSKLMVVYTFVYRHDVAIVSVTCALPYGATAVSPQGPRIAWGEFYPGWYVNVTVLARNEGNATESFSVTVYYGNETIGTQAIDNLDPGADMSLTFAWNVTGVAPCKYNYTGGYYVPYAISASASTVSGETDTADNLMSDGNVTVKWPGDGSGPGDECDGKADVFDLTLLGMNWYMSYPGYDCRVDWNGDGKADIFDLTLLGLNWYMQAQPA